MRQELSIMNLLLFLLLGITLISVSLGDPESLNKPSTRVTEALTKLHGTENTRLRRKSAIPAFVYSVTFRQSTNFISYIINYLTDIFKSFLPAFFGKPESENLNSLIVDYVLKGTSVTLNDDAEQLVLAEILQNGEANGALGITQDDEKIIFANVERLFGQLTDPKMRKLSRMQKNKLVATMLKPPPTSAPVNGKVVIEKASEYINSNSNGEFNSAPTFLDKKRVITCLILKGTDVAVESINQVNEIGNYLLERHDETNVTIAEEVGTQIKNNAVILFRNSPDVVLRNLTSDSARKVIANMLLIGIESLMQDPQNMIEKVHNFLNILTDGIVDDLNVRNIEKQKAVLNLVLENTQVQVANENDVETLTHVILGESRDSVPQNDQKTIITNTIKLFNLALDDDLGKLNDQSRTYLFADFLMNDEKSLVTNVDQLIDAAKILINIESSGEYNAAASDIEKNKVIARMLLQGTSIIDPTEEHVKIISEVLRSGLDTVAEDLNADDIDRIRFNAIDLAGHSSRPEVKILTDASKAKLIGFLIVQES